MNLVPSGVPLATGGSGEADLAAGVTVDLAKSTGVNLNVVHVKLLPLTSPYPKKVKERLGKEQ